MDKISSILSPSARVTSVDLDQAPPARPGSPNVGQKQGAVRINDRFNLSQQAKEMASKDTMMKMNPREASRAKIAQMKTDEFFMNRVREKEPVMSEKAYTAIPSKVIESLEKYDLQQPEEDYSSDAPTLSLEA